MSPSGPLASTQAASALRAFQTEIAFRLAGIEAVGLQPLFHGDADLVGQRLADPDQDFFLESCGRLPERIHHRLRQRRRSGVGSPGAGKHAGNWAPIDGAGAANPVDVERNAPGDALAQRQQPVGEVEDESRGESGLRVQRAAPRRFAPGAQALARVLVDAEAVVIGIAEQDHRLDAAEIGGADQKLRRRFIVLRVERAVAGKLGKQQDGLRLLLRHAIVDERFQFLVAEAARAAVWPGTGEVEIGVLRRCVEPERGPVALLGQNLQDAARAVLIAKLRIARQFQPGQRRGLRRVRRLRLHRPVC